ncbi:molecular chaperone DnaK [Jannaschia pagri]|uniref:Molecular chaperone DnaK n=1 Tax=Jannaschia pagri TaxID=2829797 RepID=A0ABQ4NJA2_9RHOB|nr:MULTISPECIES: Hsp70 family protein [unclassified Jannaschia]GIT90625.1 molecular chaperone DnaK [Jannaschia sp. AI_61]GIT94457.1 molecular chaperone DnaK [Jannaschia sp. AI_62]
MTNIGHTLGIDFGTSNSAAAVMCDGRAHLIEMAPGETGLPTTFFFDFDSRETLIGTPANDALLEGRDGRFMRALKRVLGTPLMHEPRQILNERVTFVEVIGRFLSEVKARAEANMGRSFDSVLSGRPVVFHGADDPREAQAEADLRACYEAAGFTQIAFLPEPEAAAVANGASDHAGELGLIVDIGGGTSDFSLFRVTESGIEILATHGIRIGGTDFDRAISIAAVMPLLGRGGVLRNAIGDGTTRAPKAIFHDLATWEKIPFLYTAQNRRAVAEMAKLAQTPKPFQRLVDVLTDELGHDLAFAVEVGKIDANRGAHGARIDLGVVERALTADLSAPAMQEMLAPHAMALRDGALDTAVQAGVSPDQVDRVIYVGGSSLMSLVPTTMAEVFPTATHVTDDVFSAVTRGLAMAADR